MIIKLGYCPYCNSENYSRDVDDWNDDYCSINCDCNDCNETFTEYYSLDEVKFDKEGEEFVYDNTLSEEEKLLILSLVREYKKNVSNRESRLQLNRIIRIMKGRLNRE